jgi:dTDP-4-dehydrorhamnose reductase
VPCGLFTSAFGPGLAAEGLSLPGVLVARTGPVYTPWDREAHAVRLLEALESGESVVVDGSSWHEVYGPDLVDGMLDLLQDGASGGYNFFPSEGWSQAEVARHIAVVAEADPALVVQATNADGAAPTYPGGDRVSHLPPSETTLERFVREARMARRAGEFAVERRQDDVRQEDAARG